MKIYPRNVCSNNSFFAVLSYITFMLTRVVSREVFADVSKRVGGKKTDLRPFQVLVSKITFIRISFTLLWKLK